MPVDHRSYRNLMPPKFTVRGRYLLLAIIAHLLLAAIFYIANIQWRSQTPPPAIAELWEELPTPQQPTPEVKTPEDTSPSPTLQEQEAIRNAEIALEESHRQEEEEAEKRRLAEEERLRLQAQEEQLRQEEEHARQQALEQQKILEQKRKEEEQRATEEKAKQEELARQKADEEKAKLEKEAQQKAEEAKQEEAKRKAAAEKARKEEEERKRRNQEQRDRIAGMAGGEGSNAAGTIGQTGGSGTGTDTGYSQTISNRLKRAITYTGSKEGNPETLIAVTVDGNTGSIKNVRIKRSSGNPEWDKAVEAAVYKNNPFPRDTNGKIPSTEFEFRFTPNEIR